MRTSFPLDNPVATSPHTTPYRFASDDDPDEAAGKLARFGPSAAARDDLPYKVELWDAAKTAVEQVLAVTVSGGIGYAAFYAATREHPDRYVTLRHKDSILSRWNG
jgi:hypothetical protein